MTTTACGYIVLTLKVHEEDGQYVARCVELGVASCGDTIDDAFEAIRDATLLYLTTLEDNGDQERVLTDQGVDVIAGAPPLDREVGVRARPNEMVMPLVLRIPMDAA